MRDSHTDHEKKILKRVQARGEMQRLNVINLFEINGDPTLLRLVLVVIKHKLYYIFKLLIVLIIDSMQTFVNYILFLSTIIFHYFT